MIEDVRFYLALFFRRIHLFLLVFIAVTGTGLTIAFSLPPVFRAEAKLLVESPQIPDDLAASTVRTATAEILSVIEQRVLTRSNLLELADRFNIYGDDVIVSADDIVTGMRKRTVISLPNARTTAGIVTVSFEAPTGALSARVTNELVTQILQQNVALRNEAAGETLQFFEQEVDRLDGALAQKGTEILAFKLENQDALPDSLDFRRTRYASVQERYFQSERELASLVDRKSRLEELYANSDAPVETKQLSPEAQRLRELEYELASSLSFFSEQNPRVKVLRAQIESLQAVVDAQEADATDEQTGEPANAFDFQLADIEAQIANLEDQRTLMEAELTALEETIQTTPGNAIGLGTLERDYENIRIQFNRATASLSEAQTGERIEALSKGQRITVVEQAVAPSEPSSPNRRKISIFSIAGGIAAGLGLISLLELLNSTVRRPVEITKTLGLRPMATIPYLRTRKQTLQRRLVIATFVVVVGGGIPFGLFLLHTYYLPMDLMIEKLSDRLGVSEFLDQFVVVEAEAN